MKEGVVYRNDRTGKPLQSSVLTRWIHICHASEAHISLNRIFLSAMRSIVSEP